MANSILAKLFVSVITNRTDLLSDIISELEKHFGPHDFVSEWFPFDSTDFYEPEMGKDLKRNFISFKDVKPADILPKTKKWGGLVEDKYRVDGKRPVNLDPGYIDFCKLVLATGKHGGHKVAVTKDCFADFIMRFTKNEWIPLPWCFPDFKSGIYNKTLMEIRNIFRNQMLSIET